MLHFKRPESSEVDDVQPNVAFWVDACESGCRYSRAALSPLLPCLSCVTITVILDLLGERCQKKSAMPLQIRDIDEELPYAASALLDSGAAWA